MSKGYIEIDQELCKGCQICIAFCTKAVISAYTKVNTSGYLPVTSNNNDACTGCGLCLDKCPTDAIALA